MSNFRGVQKSSSRFPPKGASAPDVVAELYIGRLNGFAWQVPEEC